jgi:tetratricopeptide (TPR) repeat protein
VAKHELEAYKWYLLAAAQGDAKAKNNVILLDLMLSPAQIAEGKRRAQVWLEQLKATSPNPVADSVAHTNRLTVAMLAFADKTGEPESAHWRYSLPRMVASPLREVKAIRIYPTEASEYGLRELKLKAGEPIDATQARKIGELIEARRVVWGDYRRQGKDWTVTAHVMNVASGVQSAELSATAADWFEVCDQLAGKILQELALQPTEAERARMKIRFTTSPAALEYYSQAYALQVERKPFAESERCARQAVAADPRCAEAHNALASCLFNQGKLEEGSQEIQEALKLKPDLEQAHRALGFLMLHQDKPDAAAKEFREAVRLDPDEPVALALLAQCYATRGEWLEAVSCSQAARRLNPVSASVRAHLGFVYAKQGERTNALLELREAASLDPKEVNALLMSAQAYDHLHEIRLAVEHYEKFLTLAREQGLNPKLVNDFAERLLELKASLSPVFVNAAEPKAYSDQSLREALQARLTAEELAQVNFPLASTPEMKVWAEQLTQGATNDFQKAHALYEALARHLNTGPGGCRTAQETYADWQTPQASFRCQEYARLFVALARDVGLKAFFVVVERDYEDKPVLHACAGILIGDKALLADPGYQWFGVPHKQFEFMDDYQAVVGQLNQSGDLARLRLAVKLQPDSALSQLNLALELMALDQWDEARRVLQTALKLDPESWLAHSAQGIVAGHENQPDLAVTHLRKAVELYPETPQVHFILADVLSKQGGLKEAREEFRAGLKYQPEPDQAAEARHAIARINEEIGSE